jgi:hypothetical protein
VVETESVLGVILAIAELDASLRRGCVSMSQNWSANPDEDQNPLVAGNSVNRLIDDERDYDPYRGIPIMSALPIDVRRRNCNRKATCTWCSQQHANLRKRSLLRRYPETNGEIP